MPRKLLMAVLATALIGSGCGDDGTRTVGPDGVPDEITIGSDQVLEVRLHGNPTTGYEWDVSEEGVLRFVDSSHEPDSDADGSPGVTTLVFEPARPGTGTLVLVYHRPWEEDVEPIERHEIAVTVTQ